LYFNKEIENQTLPWSYSLYFASYVIKQNIINNKKIRKLFNY
jgi:hypothetical protein